MNPILTKVLASSAEDDLGHKAAWDILTALRGPDALHESFLKDKYTIYIRAWAFPERAVKPTPEDEDEHRYPGDSIHFGAYFGPYLGLEDFERKASEAVADGQKGHCLSHIVRALKGIIYLERRAAGLPAGLPV